MSNTNTLIMPTVGRIVHYFETLDIEKRQEPSAAIIVGILDGLAVNLSVFMPEGKILGLSNVPYHQFDSKIGYWVWPPRT